MMDNDEFGVGSTVRATWPGSNKATRRATIATIQNETASIIFEDDAPRPLFPLQNLPNGKLFWIAPYLQNSPEQSIECDIHVHKLSPLLAFEKNLEQSVKDLSVEEWKAYGDQLLRVGDASAAVPYYESALTQSCRLEIGSTIIIQINGFPKIAEIDCIEENSIDVTLLESDLEKTIQQNNILLCLQKGDSERMQPRILLNLARCLLQQAEVAVPSTNRKPQYLRRAVLAATLAHTIVSHIDNDPQDNVYKTSLLLRARAQLEMGKFPHAKTDLSKILDKDPDNAEAIRLLRKVEQEQVVKQKAEKKLVKEVCQWVNVATEKSVSKPLDAKARTDSESNKSSQKYGARPIPWLFILLILLAVVLYSKPTLIMPKGIKTLS